MRKKRLEFLDIAKAIGIICVVTGHTNSPLHSFVYLFHMPLFFFISGYLYKEDYNTNLLLLLKRRFKTLYLPFIYFGLFFLLYHDVFEDLIISPGVHKHFNLLESGKRALGYLSFGFTVNKIMDPLLSPMWFVMSLFAVEVLYCGINFSLLKCKIKKIARLLPGIVLLLAVAATYLKAEFSGLPNIQYLRVHLLIPFVVLFFFYGGVLYRKYGNLVKMNWFTCLLSLIVLAILSFFLQFDVYLLQFNWMNHELNSFSLFLYYPVSFLGIYFIISLCRLYEKFLYNKLLIYIGRNTLQILALHWFAFHLVNLALGHSFYLPFPPKWRGDPWPYPWILYTLAGVFIPILLKFIYEKYLSGRISTLFVRTSDRK